MDRPINSYYYREPEKNKKSKKGKRRTKIFFNIFFMILFILIFVALVRSPVFKMQRIEVKGNERVSYEEILRIADIEEGTTLWQVNNRVLKKRLEKMPLINSARVSYVFPQALAIDVKEKEPIALIPYWERYLEISEDRTILGAADEMEDLPLMTGIIIEKPYVGQKVDPGEIIYLEEILRTISNMSSQELSFFSDFKVKDPLNLKVYTIDGTEIWLGKDNYEKKLEEVPRVLMEIKRQKEEEPGYIDLRVSHFPPKR
ncbi:MAG: FtsQ-type POTRA domain-containing protein [Candidatus Syntrophonatronum acetioxidans]|uniref:FtsQ-type POTRA domain-containing protein n=1 Tax=Candidatus Syntrophonatronum acetioxidans TaxID=1795816 RepID=A0A424YB72_9FIRM|nr:MAG: FtsQ-type POTRA domain-containing protein [Candidatus Syntrophonatronum acetioxidans]